jgi:hypothetical protein
MAAASWNRRHWMSLKKSVAIAHGIATILQSCAAGLLLPVPLRVVAIR